MLNACFVYSYAPLAGLNFDPEMASHSHKNAHYNRAKFLLLHTFAGALELAFAGLAKSRSRTYLCCTHICWQFGKIHTYSYI